jgi:hypothetical protein
MTLELLLLLFSLLCVYSQSSLAPLAVETLGGNSNFSVPTSIATDDSGNVFLSDVSSSSIRSWTNLPVLDKLTNSGRPFVRGAYSLNRLSMGYMGPTIKIRRSSDNATLDFYSNKDGIMGSSLDGGGTPLVTWLGNSIAYVVTWYDQSGTSNHANQGNNEYQPIYNQSAMAIDSLNSNSRFLTIPSGTIPTGSIPYSFVFKHGTQQNPSGAYFASSGTENVVRGASAASYTNSWGNNAFSFGETSTKRPGDTVTIRFNGTTQWGYINNNLTGTITRSGMSTSTGTQYLFRDSGNGTTSFLNGQLHFVYIFNTSLSDADQITAQTTLVQESSTGKITTEGSVMGITYFNNTVYFTESCSNRVRKLDYQTRNITTFAGGGNLNTSNITATDASLSYPHGIAYHNSSIFVCDSANNRIVSIHITTGILIVIAGNGTGGYNGENRTALLTTLSGPSGIAVSASGDIYFTEWFGHRVRKISATTRLIATVVGTGSPGYSNGVGTVSQLNFPFDLEFISNILLISDSFNHCIRKYNESSGMISNYIGNCTHAGQLQSTNPASTFFNRTKGMAFQPNSAYLYIADGFNNQIKRVLVDYQSSSATTSASSVHQSNSNSGTPGSTYYQTSPSGGYNYYQTSPSGGSTNYQMSPSGGSTNYQMSPSGGSTNYQTLGSIHIWTVYSHSTCCEF